MNQSNCQIIRERILEAAKKLEGRLPQSYRHPAGRNPYAHIPKVIKSIFGSSYKHLEDDSLDQIIEVIKYCEENPF